MYKNYTYDYTQKRIISCIFILFLLFWDIHWHSIIWIMCKLPVGTFSARRNKIWVLISYIYIYVYIYASTNLYHLGNTTFLNFGSAIEQICEEMSVRQPSWILTVKPKKLYKIVASLLVLNLNSKSLQLTLVFNIFSIWIID